MTLLRPLLAGLRLGLLAACWILASEVVYSHAFLPFTVRFDADLIGLYALLFTALGLVAGIGGVVLVKLGRGVPATLLGALLAVLLLALRIHDYGDVPPNLQLDGGLIVYALAGAASTAWLASRIPAGEALDAAPTVLFALFVPLLVFASKLLVNTSPIDLAQPIPVALAMVALWPLATTALYRAVLCRVVRPARLVVALWVIPVLVTMAGAYVSGPLAASSVDAAIRHADDTSDKPPIIWVTIDTLRTDHMSLYGYGIPTTPNLETFAATATVYQNAFSQAPSTWQSVPTLLSGVTPYRHGGVTATRKLHDDLRMIPEMLDDLGYQTIGESANPWVSERYGMTQGFQDFRLYNTDNELLIYDFMKLAMRVAPWQVFSVREHLPAYGYVPAGTLVDDAIHLLRTHDTGKPLFFYMQPVDPHGPYQAPLRYVPAHGAGFTKQDYVSYWALKTGVSVTPRQHDGLLALYDGAITYTDAEVGRLFDELRELGIFDKALIVVTADHGEQFYDHQLWRHSNSLYQALIHVPLVVKYPHQRVGVIVPERVATMDIVPTIMRTLGQTCATCEGLPLQQPTNQRALYSYLMDKDTTQPRIRSVVSDSWKLIRAQRDGTTVEELYNLEMDPQELRNERAKYARIAADLGQLLDAYEKAAGPTPDAETITLDAGERERLRALGYVQ
jgi:arylsulfatase A-like enzyme